MPQWQYREVNLSELPPETDEIDLVNAAGDDGWELVVITRNNIAYPEASARRSSAGASAARVRTCEGQDERIQI